MLCIGFEPLLAAFSELKSHDFHRNQSFIPVYIRILILRRGGSKFFQVYSFLIYYLLSHDTPSRWLAQSFGIISI